MFVRHLLLLCCLISPLSAWAAEAAGSKPYRIMMMLYRGSTEAEKGFMDYFKRHRIPVEFIIRDAHADKTRIAEFIREAREQRPDLIYTFGTTVTSEVAGVAGEVDPARHITDIPIIFNIVADPVGARLVTDLKSSGRNLTGASHMVPLPAQMQALQAMRNGQKLGVIYNPNEKNSQLAVQGLEKVAPRFSISLQKAAIRPDARNQPSTEGIVAAMQELLEKKPQFIYIPSDSFLIQNAALVVQAAQKAGIPVFSATEAPIRERGALLGLVSTYSNVGELAAYKAVQILQKKTPASSIPIETLNRFTYLVNMKTAKKLGIYPPLSVMKFAELITPTELIDARE
jgi:putative ABC transport system substrate-binding protein